MLSRLDDYPVHQTSHPLAQSASADRNCYDRYWFNGYDRSGEFYFGIGAARYPNLEITDGAFSIVHKGRQHSFFASRRSGAEASEIAVGPFSIEIIEPMKSLRVTVDANETGISCDLLWIPRSGNFQEGHQYTRRGRTTMDATRFNQFGYWQGEIRYGSEVVTVDPTRVYGTKDRSWGTRPVGDPDPGGAPPQQLPQVFFLWAPLHWPDHCSHVGLFENEFGEIWHWDGMRVPAYENPEAIPLVEDPGVRPYAAVDEWIDYLPGTRRARRAVIGARPRDGERFEIELEPVLCFRMKGIGYTHPEWGHGRWKGELAIGGESWDCDSVDPLGIENQHIQQVVVARCNGVEGVGVLEQICLGPHSRYGFSEFLDGAPE